MSRKGEKNWVRIFEVTNPTRHKKGFTVYKVTSKVFPKTFPEGVTTISVYKRYNDFKRLYKELQVIHKQLHLSGDFPRFPKAKAFGFGRFDYDIVEERRKSALTLLDFAAKHSQLFTHKTFVQFFESGYKMKEIVDSGVDQVDSGNSSVNGQCLVPEKLWSGVPAVGPGTNEDDDGDISISSLESSSADTTTFTTDSDSVVSNSVFSDTPNPHAPKLMHPSHTVDFGTFSCGLNSESRENPPSIPSAKASSSGSIGSKSDVDGASHSNPKKSGSIKMGDKDPFLGDNYTEAETRSQSSSFSHVSSSKSCPSLDDINGMYSSSSSTANTQQLNQQQHQQKQEEGKEKIKGRTANRSLKPSWSLSLRRKPNGFAGGFFDFLPIFPKKTEEKKVSDEKLLADSLAASYICEAAGHFAVAQQLESNGELPKALDSYKEGIRILLNGGQSDKDHKRRIIVRSKVEKYLSKAEALHSSLHVGKSSNNLPTPALFSPKKVQGLILPSDASSVKTEYMKPSPIEDLRNYKVVGVATVGVIVVVNIAEKRGPKCYAIKVLKKSASPLVPDNETIIPSQVPFMVKLVKWFNSENTIILLLQYAGGGRLEDFVLTYQTKQISIIPHEISPNDSSPGDMLDEKERDDRSTEERKSAMTVLAAFCEQLENNENLEDKEKDPEELCESYARLFKESDSEKEEEGEIGLNEEQHSQLQQKKQKGRAESVVRVGDEDELKSNAKGNDEEGDDDEGRKGRGEKEGRIFPRKKIQKECEGNSSEKVRKLAVDFTGDVNEALESKPETSIPGAACTKTIDRTETRVTATTTTSSSIENSEVKGSSLFPSGGENNSVNHLSWSNLDAVDTSDLIESSKVLIQTVSRTLTQCDASSSSSSSAPVVLAVSTAAVAGSGRGVGPESELKDLSLSESKEKQPKKKNRNRNKKHKKKNYGQGTSASISQASLSSSSSRDYYDYNKGTTSAVGVVRVNDDDNDNDGGDSVSNRNRASSSSFVCESVDSSASASSSSSFMSSLPLLERKQREMETNETENNKNNKGSSQNQSGVSSLMSGESKGVSESKSQFIRLPLNQKRRSKKKETLSLCTDGENDGDDGKGRQPRLISDCYSFNSKTETSTDELLVGEILQEEVEEEEENEDGGDNDDDDDEAEQEEGMNLGKREGNTTEMASHYGQPFLNNGESNEKLDSYESLPIQRMVPECCIKVWAAEMVLCLEKLHSIGITYGDLGMRNILLGENGHILLSFTGQWTDVDFVQVRSQWVAPEARNSFPSECSRGKIHFSADWWSLGAILFYLLTGQTVESCHPEGFHPNTVLKILDRNLCGDDITNHAKSLLTELLQINPNLRLGFYGAGEIKSHPFFGDFDWETAIESTSH